LLKKSEKELRKIRGKNIAYILQNPMTCLNPTKTIKKQITEVMQDAKDKEARAEQLLYKVGISDPKQKLLCYPHELSGGTLQRIVIAISLVNNPRYCLLTSQQQHLTLPFKPSFRLLQSSNKNFDEYDLSHT